MCPLHPYPDRDFLCDRRAGHAGECLPISRKDWIVRRAETKRVIHAKFTEYLALRRVQLRLLSVA